MKELIQDLSPYAVQEDNFLIVHSVKIRCPNPFTLKEMRTEGSYRQYVRELLSICKAESVKPKPIQKEEKLSDEELEKLYGDI